MKDISELDLKSNIPLAAKRDSGHRTRVRVGDVEVGGDRLVIIAGPCAVENYEQTYEIARRVKAAGAGVLRGGAFKPLTFPYRSPSVYELREKGLEILARVRRKVGIPVVTEVMDIRLVDAVNAAADMLQIGARNMQNFPLLEEVAKTGKPVLLKRHFGASLRDWLGAAEYLLYNGNPNVVLCERGIAAPHTHLPTSRFIVDLEVVPAAQEVTHLPIIVDPSHATFRRSFVPSVARAAIAVGADGVMLDVHPTPEKAAVDPLQALSFETFEFLVKDLWAIGRIVGRDVQ
jgi:3-deoxy-7-phosphoheptulonate synthase